MDGIERQWEEKMVIRSARESKGIQLGMLCRRSGLDAMRKDGTVEGLARLDSLGQFRIIN